MVELSSCRGKKGNIQSSSIRSSLWYLSCNGMLLCHVTLAAPPSCVSGAEAATKAVLKSCQSASHSAAMRWRGGGGPDGTFLIYETSKSVGQELLCFSEMSISTLKLWEWSVGNGGRVRVPSKKVFLAWCSFNARDEGISSLNAASLVEQDGEARYQIIIPWSWSDF